MLSIEDRPRGAGCECTTELSGCLPDNLGEMRICGVVGVIFLYITFWINTNVMSNRGYDRRTGFSRPQVNGTLNRKGTGTSSKILCTRTLDSDVDDVSKGSGGGFQERREKGKKEKWS